MRTPFFEDLCAEIRGIDLGDDAWLTERLALRASGEHGLDHEAWLLFAVLSIRSDADADAMHALARAEAAGASPPVVAFLRAHLLAGRGELDAAAAALEATAALETADAGKDAAIATADLEHARGALAWARGDTTAALAHFGAGLADDPHDGRRWLDAGRLQANMGRWDGAEQAFAEALAQDDDLDDAHYERAALWLARDRVEAAATTLASLAERAPWLRERARLDPRWRAVRNLPAVAAVLTPSPRPPVWLGGSAAWLPELAREQALTDLGITWLGADESAAHTERLALTHQRGAPGIIHTPATTALWTEELADAVVVARGPVLVGRDRRCAPMLWVLDRRRDALRLLPSERYPAFLWIPAGRDVASMRAAMHGLVPQPFAGRTALAGRARGFIGYRKALGVPSPYTGELEPAGAAELDRHFALSPFVEPGAWGSSRIDDPWPDEMPAQPHLQLRMAAREQIVTEQAKHRVWSIARRTRHSRSILAIELHHRDIFVADVRYRPTSDNGVIAAMNRRFGTEYPTDMPVDVVAALLGFRFDAAADLETQLATHTRGGDASDPSLAAGLLQVISALRHDDLAVGALYRRWVDHDDSVVRSTLYNIFVAHNHESLLEEACVTEPDAELRAQIEAILDEGTLPVHWDPYRDDEDEDEDEK